MHLSNLNQRDSMLDIAVAGGGIGGLAAALALASQGHNVIVFERGSFGEVGAGIQLAPNGLDALDRMGILREVLECAIEVDSLQFHDGVQGDLVADLQLTGDYSEHFGFPYVVIHRADLHRILHEACTKNSRVELRDRSTVSSFTQFSDVVEINLASGESHTCELLIGADGINSAVRSKMVNDGEPIAAGITVYRTVVPMEKVPGRLRSNSAVWWAGEGQHLVHYPIAGNRYLNIAPSSETSDWKRLSNVPTSRSFIMQEFSGFCEDARLILSLGANWRAWSLVDREPIPAWSQGRVALLGDAAHASLHYLAQGACQALMDATVLSEELSKPSAGDVPLKLQSYSIQRSAKAAEVQLEARRSIKLWHARGSSRRKRNSIMRQMSTKDKIDFVDWLHAPLTR